MSQAGSVSGSGGGGTFTPPTFTDKSTDFTAVVNNGYFCTAALTATLPAVATQGQIVIIETTTASNVIIDASGTDVIRMGSTASSAGGTATSSAAGNSVYLVYRSANTSWYSISTEGTWVLA